MEKLAFDFELSEEAKAKSKHGSPIYYKMKECFHF